jgi:hypothetical protein
MKIHKLFPVLALAVFPACGSNPSTAPVGAAPASQPQAAELVMPQVNYPAAMVFEGGKGDPWFDDSGTKHKAAWRVYICLPKVSNWTNGEATIDLEKLGEPIQATYNDSHGSSEVTLKKVKLKYKFYTELSADPDNNGGYAYGDAGFQSTSEQDWEPKHEDWMDIDLFNQNAGGGTLASFSDYKYGDSYITVSLDRFTFSRKDHRVHVITPCEKANQTVVVEQGQLSPLN